MPWSSGKHGKPERVVQFHHLGNATQNPPGLLWDLIRIEFGLFLLNLTKGNSPYSYDHISAWWLCTFVFFAFDSETLASTSFEQAQVPKAFCVGPFFFGAAWTWKTLTKVEWQMHQMPSKSQCLRLSLFLFLLLLFTFSIFTFSGTWTLKKQPDSRIECLLHAFSAFLSLFAAPLDLNAKSVSRASCSKETVHSSNAQKPEANLFIVLIGNSSREIQQTNINKRNVQLLQLLRNCIFVFIVQIFPTQPIEISRC